MAAITAIGATAWTTTAGDKTSAPTPAAGCLIVCIGGNSGRTTAQAPTVSDTLPGGTYTIHSTAATTNTSADSMWVAVRNNLVTDSAATTITWSPPGAADTGGGFRSYQITGMTRCGLNAIRQVGKQDNQAAGTPSITMGTAFLTGNCGIGMILDATNGSANCAPPTSWTESADTGYTTPPTGMEQCRRDSGETNTTIAWTAATPSGFASLLVEFDTTIQLIPDFSTEPKALVRP